MLYVTACVMMGLAAAFAGVLYIAIMSTIVRAFGLFGYCFVVALNTLGPILLIACLAL